MNLTLDEKINKAQAILNEFFSGLKMVAFPYYRDALIISCDIHYMSSILLAPGEITKSVIRIRILDMLKDMKRIIELDIQEIENG